MLARSVSLNIVGQAGTLLIGLATTVILARWLGPTDRGLLAVLTAAAMLVLAFLGLGLPLAVGYYASRPTAPLAALFGNGLAYAASLAALLLPLSWLAAGPLGDTLGGGGARELWVLAAGLVPLTFLGWIASNQLVGRLRFGVFNLVMLGSRAAILVGALVLVVWLDRGIAGALVTLGIGELVVVVVAFPFAVPGRRPSFELGLLRRMLAYGSRVQPGAVFELLTFRLDVVILQFFRPLREVGVYIAAQVLAELVMRVARAFQTSTLPLASHLEGDVRQRSTSIAAVKHYGIVAAAATVANIVAGPLIIYFGYGAGFEGALTPFLILLPGIFFLGAGTVVLGDLRGRGRPGTASSLAVAAAAAVTALDLLLIPPLGATGAALASLAAYSLFGLLAVRTLANTAGFSVREALPSAADLHIYRHGLQTALRATRRS